MGTERGRSLGKRRQIIPKEEISHFSGFSPTFQTHHVLTAHTRTESPPSTVSFPYGLKIFQLIGRSLFLPTYWKISSFSSFLFSISDWKTLVHAMLTKFRAALFAPPPYYTQLPSIEVLQTLPAPIQSGECLE